MHVLCLSIDVHSWTYHVHRTCTEWALCNSSCICRCLLMGHLAWWKMLWISKCFLSTCTSTWHWAKKTFQLLAVSLWLQWKSNSIVTSTLGLTQINQNCVYCDFPSFTGNMPPSLSTTVGAQTAGPRMKATFNVLHTCCHRCHSYHQVYLVIINARYRYITLLYRVKW